MPLRATQEATESPALGPPYGDTPDLGLGTHSGTPFGAHAFPSRSPVGAIISTSQMGVMRLPTGALSRRGVELGLQARTGRWSATDEACIVAEVVEPRQHEVVGENGVLAAYVLDAGRVGNAE